MKHEQFASLVLQEAKRLWSEYSQRPEDAFGKGHAAMALIDPQGKFYGEIYGPDKAQAKGFAGIAWRKVNQVWLTGHATGDFERAVFAGQLDEGDFSINKPDYIGWEGGVPFEADGQWSGAFSGCRGTTDVAIVHEAVAAAKQLNR